MGYIETNSDYGFMWFNSLIAIEHVVSYRLDVVLIWFKSIEIGLIGMILGTGRLMDISLWNFVT